MCSQGDLLDFKNEEYVVLYLLSGQGPASSIILLLWSFCCYGVSVHTVQPGAHLSPVSLGHSKYSNKAPGFIILVATPPSENMEQKKQKLLLPSSQHYFPFLKEGSGHFGV